MNEQKHIISRLVLEVAVPERGHAQSIQNKTSDIVKNTLHPALNSLFSSLTSTDEIIRIDKLVIDLGNISKHELEKELVGRAVKEIGEKIIRLKNSGAAVNGHPSEIKEKYTTSTEANELLEQFVFFLQTGRFPWWHKLSVRNGASVANANKNIFKEVLNVENALLKNAIIPLLKNNRVRKRLVFQFNHSYLYELFKRLNLTLLESYSACFQDLISCVESASFIKTLTNSFYEIIPEYFSIELELKSEGQKIIFVKDILDSGLSKLPDNEKEKILAEILHSAQLKLQGSQHGEIIITMVAVIQIATEIPSKSQLLKKMIQELPKKYEAVLINSIKINGRVNQVNEQEVKTENNHKTYSLFPPKPSADAEQIVVLNAGLVLIHPFLKYFFEGLNLLNKELLFKSQWDAFKAIHLLQFIATGVETSPEESLPLNKILCGLDISEPVPKSAELSEEEKEECLFLIKTVLERWEALKTSNPLALRETYLQREGILKQSGSAWNLTIERNSFDVMLEKLPWSINLIKLPWLSQILYVEW